MFPTVRWPGLAKLHLYLMLFTGVMAFNFSSIRPEPTTHNANPNQPLSQVEALESRLALKAERVLRRMTDQPFTVDLSVTMDCSQRTTVTHFAEGSWQQRIEQTPNVAVILCCVTVEGRDPDLDTDHLYRCLAYTLGIDLVRGDLLKIVTR